MGTGSVLHPSFKKQVCAPTTEHEKGNIEGHPMPHATRMG